MKNNFSRSNVNESTLQITDPMRSSFDLSHRNNLTLKLGRLTPVNLERLIGTDVIQGSLKPQFQLEVAGTPTIGKLRLDTHTFQVNMRRIHNGFRQFIEDVSNNSLLPHFDVAEIALVYIQCVRANTSGTYTTPSSHYDVFFDSDQLPVSTDSAQRIAQKLLESFRRGLYNHSIVQSTEYGYMKDFLAIEVQRIADAITHVPNDDSAIVWALYQILLPLFGEGSLLDMLGYPIYRRDTAWYQALSVVGIATKFKGTLTDYDVIDLLRAYDYKTSTQTIQTLPADYQSEMPLRAAYAVYYDYFRDWHVEPRSQVLDPDTFGIGSVFLKLIGDLTGSLNSLSHILQLLVLRYRYFARDFLTTVQTDDIYRHVYAPVFGDVTDLSQDNPAINIVVKSVNNSTAGTTPADLINTLYKLSSSVPFLSDSIFSYPSTSIPPSSFPENSFAADLQTMRRAGMLEKWLARNYFFPDTYVGQLRARYGVAPEDVNVLISQYLGGTESFVEGNQIVAPVDTPQMSAGNRTVVSGVNGSDSFSYQASDHCYIISFVSLMPLVNYDLKNMHNKELRVMDIPAPEFAQDSRVAIMTKDMLRGFDYQNEVLGYVPRYYHYRVHGDETHGRYLSDLRSYAWFRDWFNMTFSEVSGVSLNQHGFRLTPYSLRVHLVPDAFNGLQIWDDIAFGSCDIEFFANRPLPAAVDII